MGLLIIIGEKTAFEKYLTVWVGLCILLGLIIGYISPNLAQALSEFEVYHVSIPIAVCLFLMIYSIMIQIDFKKVTEAAKTPKPVFISSTINWLIKPFTKMMLALLFFMVIFKEVLPLEDAQSYTAGLILLGIAPCTAMVLMWVHLAKGNQGLNLVMIAIDSIIMIFVYAPLASLLLGVADIIVPWGTIAFSIAIYIGIPLIFGYGSRTILFKKKGEEWFNNSFSPIMGKISKAALLITLVILFILQGEVIIKNPIIILIIAIPLTVQFFLIFFIGFYIAKAAKLKYEDAVPVALVGTSNHFEVAIAVAIMLSDVIGTGAALAAVVGVLIEVPIMLWLVKIMKNNKSKFA
jgi:ACR3 family arsenite transporter